MLSKIMLPFVCGCLCLGVAEAFLGSALDVQQQLGMAMAESNQKLAIAERHEKKAIKKTKVGLSKLLSEQATLLATEMKRYAVSMSSAAEGLQETAASSKLALSMQENASSSSSDWSGVAKRARLGAKVKAAESEVRRLMRKRESSLLEASREAKAALDDSASQLTRQLGDLSEILDKQYAVLDDAEKAAANTAMSAASTKTKVGNASMSLAAIEQSLAASKHATADQVAKARSHFDDFLKRASANLTRDTMQLKRKLEEVDQKELKKLRSSDEVFPEVAKKPAAAASAKHVQGKRAKAPLAKKTL